MLLDTSGLFCLLDRERSAASEGTQALRCFATVFDSELCVS